MAKSGPSTSTKGATWAAGSGMGLGKQHDGKRDRQQVHQKVPMPIKSTGQDHFDPSPKYPAAGPNAVAKSNLTVVAAAAIRIEFIRPYKSRANAARFGLSSPRKSGPRKKVGPRK
jgi:hypothetical protein